MILLSDHFHSIVITSPGFCKKISKNVHFLLSQDKHEQGEAELSLWIPVSMAMPGAAEMADPSQKVMGANLDSCDDQHRPLA